MRRSILTPEELTLFTAELGTEEWAMRKKQRLEKIIDAAEDDIINLDIEAVEFIQGKGWSLLPRNEEGERFRVFREFALADRPYGLGCTEKQFRIMVAVCDVLTPTQEQAMNTQRPLEIQGKHLSGNNYNMIEDRGTSADYLTARIARDRPEIYAEMIRGKYRSVRQAAIEAGIVTPTTRYSLPDDPIAAARYLAQRVDQEWMGTMVAEFMNLIEA